MKKVHLLHVENRETGESYIRAYSHMHKAEEEKERLQALQEQIRQLMVAHGYGYKQRHYSVSTQKVELVEGWE